MRNKASVIIPTRGRDQCLRKVLEDLSVQDFSDFDVWIVDQNEAPLQALANHAGKISLEHVVMPPRGSHAGRNRAIFATSAEVCIFVDDDVRLGPEFVRKHVIAYEKLDSGVAAVCGRVVQPQDGYTEEDMDRMARLARYDPWMGKISGNFLGKNAGSVDHIHECNFSARTEILKTVDGFNEEFQGNAYFEGAELGLRLQRAGFSLHYDGQISLIHLQEGSGGNREKDKAKHTYWFMRNYGLLNSTHMNKWSMPVFGLYGLSYVLAKALKNRDASIAREGLKGLKDGLKYFSPRATRFTRRVE